MRVQFQDNLNHLASFFKVFSDETRLRILDSLLSGDKCVGDIASVLGISPSAVSHQLKSLRDLNLVKTIKNGQNVTYSITDEHIRIILEYGLEHIKEKIV